MQRVLYCLLVVLFLLPVLSFAQNDCPGVTVCGNGPIAFNPIGPGNNDFAGGSSPGCLATGETNSAWYYFEIDATAPPNQTLGFVLNPTPTADYDFAIYGPNLPCTALGSPIRCSWAAGSIPTGLGGGATDFSEGAGGDGFVQELTVQPGEGYFMIVNNFSGNGNGFNLSWTGTGSNYLNCNATPPCGLLAEAGNPVIECEGGPPFALNGSAVGGNPSTTSYSWSGSGVGFLNSPNIPTPLVTIPPGAAGSYTFILTANDNGCIAMDQVTITITPQPIVTFQPATVSVCSSDPPTNLVAIPPGGTWSVNAPGGVIDPSSPFLMPGPNIVTYDYVDPSGCAAMGTTTVIVNPSPNVMVQPLPPLCASSNDPVPLITSIPGGVWSPNVINGTIIPSLLGPGQTAAIYNYVDPSTGCTGSTIVPINVIAPETVTIIDPGPVCAGGLPFALTAFPPNGFWGATAPNGLFDPLNLSPGLYPVEYTYVDPSGCSVTETLNISVTVAPQATIQGNFTLCASDGQQTFTATPGGGTWSNNAPNGIVDPATLGVGTHSIVYSANDPNSGCSILATETITVSDAPSVMIQPVANLCSSSGPQTLFANPSGGTWSSNASGGVFDPTGLSSGMYSVSYSFTDPSTNCTDTEMIDIIVGSSPTVSINGDNSICDGASASLNATGGFNNYQWSNNENTNSVTVFNAGTYTVTVTNAEGCTGTAQFAVAQSNALTPTISASNSSICNGNSSSLTADSGYSSYNWSTSDNSPTISVNQGGTYTVTVTDANSCTGTAEFVMNSFPSPTPTISGNPSFCSGGSASVTVDNYASYVWSNNTTGPTLTVSSTGTFTVTVTDANGCTGTATTQISENTIAAPSIVGVPSFCEGDNTSLSLSTTYNTYLWSDGSTSPIIVVSQNGMVGVTVSDGNSCTSEASINVVQNPTPDPTISGSATICQGTATTLDAGAWSNYIWSDNSTGSTLNVNSPGTFTVTVTDATGCTGIADFMVEVSASLQPVIVGDFNICEGTSTTLDAGSGFDSYSWSDGSTSQTISPSQSGTFTVTVSDASGCTGEGFVNVTSTTNPQPMITGMTSFCAGNTATINAGTWDSYIWSDNSTGQTLNTGTAGTYTVTVTNADGCIGTSEVTITESGIAAPSISGDINICQGEQTTLDVPSTYASYLWSNGSTMPTSTFSQNGMVSVTVTDAAGCTSEASVNITQNQNPTPTIAGSTTFCQGNATTLDAGSWVSYVWSDNSTDQTLSVSSPGTYTVTISDVNGCTGTTEVMVDVSASLQPVIAGNLNFCEGSSTTLDAGSGFDSYSWSDGTTLQTISPTQSGTFTVTVSDASGCTGTEVVNVTSSPNPEPTLTGITSICSGNATTIDAGTWDSYLWSDNSTDQTLTIMTAGTYTVTVSLGGTCTGTSEVVITESTIAAPNISGDNNFCEGNTTMLEAESGFDSYSWSDGSTTPMVSISQPGDFTVTVTDANGCTNESTVSIVENPAPVPSLMGATSFCDGSSTTINAGSWNTYLWSDNSTNNEITITQAGTYSVTVTDLDGCTGTSEINITVNAELQPVISGATEICEGNTTTLEVGAWDTYSWSDGSTTPTISPTQSGTFTVTVSDASGCTGTTQSNVLFNENPTPQISGSASFCVGTTTTLDAGSWTTYSWSDNSTDQTLSVGTPGTYTVTVTNDNGCTGTTELVVSESTSLDPSISGALGFCQNENTLLDAGQGFASYTWSDGSTSQTLDVTASGTYAVTVMDASGCTGETSVDVMENTPPSPSIIGATSFCTGNSTIIDAGDFDSYLWSDGSLSQTLEVFISGTYSVIVTDGNGCTAETAIDVSELTSLDPMVTGPSALCPNETITLTAANGFVSYEWSDNSTGETLDVSASGTYTVTITDANGCTGEQTLSIAQNTPPSTSITGANEICQGGTTTLSAETGFDSYLWSDQSTDISLAVSQAGTYTVTITDANGCTGTMEETVSELSEPTVAISGNNSFCSNGSTDLEGSSGFASYMWSDGTTNPNITITTPGTYTLTVVDMNGCTTSEEITVSENSSLMPSIIGASSFCSGNSTILDATGNYTDYLWSDNSTNPTLEIFLSGTYTVTVTDASGCTGTMEQAVTETTSLQPTISGATNFCPNESVMVEAEVGYIGYEWSNSMTTSNIEITSTGTFTVTVTDASGCTGTNEISITENIPPSPSIAGSTSFCSGFSTTLDVGNTFDQYLWSDGSTGSTLEVATDGMISVTVTDANGCTGETAVQVDESTQLNPNISGAASFCSGTSTTLDAGSGFTNYLWSDGTSSQTLEITTPGTFTVTVTDLSGCTGETFLDVTEDAPVSAGVANASLTLCSVDASNFLLGNELTGADLNGQWSETSNTASTGNAFDPTNGTFNTMGQAAGTYTFEYLVASNGTCAEDSETVTVVIEESPEFTIIPNATTITCIQEEIIFDVLHTGAPNVFQYSWTSSDGNIVSGNNTAITTIDAAGLYLVTVTAAASGCTSTAEITIDANNTPPDADAGQAQNLTCDVSSVTLNGTTTLGANAVFTWSGNGINSSNMNVQNPSVEEAGIYTLVVTDSNNGCESEEVTVEVTTDSNIPSFTLDPVGNLDCNNNSQIIAGPLGQNYTYQWLLDNNPITGATDPSYEATSAGIYSLIITDSSNGCSSSESLEVVSTTDLPDAEAGENALLTCQAGAVSLSGNGSSTGANISYSWIDPNGNEVSTTLTFDATQAGNYTLIVTNNTNGCSATDMVTVDADADLPTADAGENTMLDCNFSPITIGGNSSTGSGITYSWSSSTGGTISNPNILNPVINQPGDYQLLVTDTNNGCSSTDAITISENTNIPTDAIIDISPITCFGDNDATITISEVIGGTEPFDYSINGSGYSTIDNFTSLGQGDYSIQILDAAGCEWTTELSIPEPPEFILNLGEDQTIQLNDSYEINAQATSPINLIEWREDATLSCLDCIDAIASPTITTTYQATAYNERGCESTDQLTIFVEKKRDIYFPNVFTPNNDGSNDFFFPQSSDIVENIKTFQIYTRWGEVVYEVTDVMPNDISIGWDGTFKGQKLNPAVFVYFAEVEFIDGVTIIFKGDVAIRK